MIQDTDFTPLVSSSSEDLIPLIDKGEDLSKWLSEKENEGQIVRTRLKASERVIARVTDGIYRQPASALRELISNAWDADANNVEIITDAPRFSRMYIRDDGAGMSYATLARLLHSIGGSAKRTEIGQELGVTDKLDSEKTPGGRLLIGKIGIGLFSISQLARRFRIVTKVANENYRLIAEVKVRAYSEDSDDESSRDEDDNFVNGEVLITREFVEDLAAHGTDIILDTLKPRVRDMLRSADRWRALKEKETALAAGDLETAQSIRVDAPKYHSGWIEDLPKKRSDPTVLTNIPKFPWEPNVPANSRMSFLIDAIEKESSRTERPDLASTLDTYLETLWTLSLSVPVEYVEKHPFELTADSGVSIYWLSNENRGQAVEVKLNPGQTVRDAVKEQIPGHPELSEGAPSPSGGFKVTIDGFELKRPIRFKHPSNDTKKANNPMLFVGRYAPNLASVKSDVRGGKLSLEAYLFWNSKIVPKENNGALVRIRGASSGVFDTTFFKYQVSEQTRLRQITTELFIRSGLDAALNIDRESFNFAHPHVQLVSQWLHKSIRQLTNKHKDLSKRARTEKNEAQAELVRDALTVHSETIWNSRRIGDPLPEITVAQDKASAEKSRSDGFMTIVREDIPSLTGVMPAAERKDKEAQAKALMRVLDAYGMLDDRPYDEQQDIIDAIFKVFYAANIK